VRAPLPRATRRPALLGAPGGGKGAAAARRPPLGTARGWGGAPPPRATRRPALLGAPGGGGGAAAARRRPLGTTSTVGRGWSGGPSAPPWSLAAIVVAGVDVAATTAGATGALGCAMVVASVPAATTATVARFCRLFLAAVLPTGRTS